MKINPNIFRAYDIRGIVGTDLNEEIAERIGYAYGTYLSELNPGKSLHIVVGRDNRPSGQELSTAFRRGVQASGVQAFDLGESPSPFLYYTVIAGDYDGGVNITASHNPSEYNGFKLVHEHAHSICGPEIKKIYEIALRNFDPTSDPGTPVEENYWQQYTDLLTSKIKLSRKLKVIIDSAGGVATNLYSKVIEKLGTEAIELYPVPDGTFPYHEPDPLKEQFLTPLKDKVKEENADLGLAFDGDGDRVFAVTPAGRFIDANQLLILLARHLLSPADHAVYTVSCSSIVKSELDKLDVQSEMVPVGHSFVENKMTETGALLGGEQSGHFFIAKDYYSYDDALFTALHLLTLVANSDQTLDQMLDSLPTVYTAPERRLTCPDDKKFRVVDQITNAFSEYNYRLETMDGVRVDMPDGAWIGIRASNTSPCLSVICEAPTPQRLQEIEKETNEILSHFPDVQL